MDITNRAIEGISVPKFAEIMDISRQHAYRLVKRREIPSIKLGERYVIPMSYVRQVFTTDVQ
jgi:excisionase family DNA binding protein